MGTSTCVLVTSSITRALWFAKSRPSALSSTICRYKSGKSRFGLSSPQPALINLDRSEDWLLQALDLDILRDRIILPPGDLTLAGATAALRQFEQDMVQAKALSKGGACETIFVDGGSQLTDIITLVKLDEAKNPNKTYRYAERNTYIRNLFNELNESGLNVVWTSKARKVWVAEKPVPGLYSPDCHDDIPYMVDVNLQLMTELSPEGQAFYGVIGTNAFNPTLVGKRIRNLEWDTMLVLLGISTPARTSADSQIRGVAASDSDKVPIISQNAPVHTRDPPASYPGSTPSIPHFRQTAISARYNNEGTIV